MTPHPHPLPPTARAVAEVIGEDLTLRLCSLHESQRRYIPKNVSIHHPGARAIGVDQWQRIVRHFGGELIDLPSCARAARQRAIKAQLASGMPPEAVAAHYGLSRRRISQLLRSLKATEETNAPTPPPVMGPLAGVPGAGGKKGSEGN